MPSLRWYVADYNGILTDLKEKHNLFITTPKDADVWVVWQDCQGSYRDLIQTTKKLGIAKPTYVVQHGRGATYDYGPPNSFTLNADKYFCWGQHDYERMVNLGYGDRTKIVGCPLNTLIKPRVPHEGKTILFVPVNTGKEEPENLMVYYELMKLRYNTAITVLDDSKKDLKKKWGFDKKVNVSYNDLTKNFEVVAKLLPWHDRNLYHGSILLGYQDQRKNNELNFKLLQNVDLVVGLDEGCTEIYAYGQDVPVIIVDGFKYHQHPDGQTPIESDIYRTKAAVHCSLNDLAACIKNELMYPNHLKKERAEVAEKELGLSYGDAIKNILTFIKNDVPVRELCG